MRAGEKGRERVCVCSSSLASFLQPPHELIGVCGMQSIARDGELVRELEACGTDVWHSDRQRPTWQFEGGETGECLLLLQ